MKAEEMQTLRNPANPLLAQTPVSFSTIPGLKAFCPVYRISTDLNPDPCCFGILSSVISPRSCPSAVYHGALQPASVGLLARHKISRRVVCLTITRTSMLPSPINFLKSAVYPGDSLFTAVLIRTRARGVAYFNT